MKSKVLIVLFNIFATSAFAGGSFGVGNGGDIIRCPVAQGYYSLDFVLTTNLLGAKVRVVKLNSFQASISRISDLIAQKLPELTSSFHAYVTSLNNTTDPTLPYIWKEEFYLEDVRDEEYVRPPFSCQASAGAPVEVSQAIVRKNIGTAENPKIQFFYDPNVIASLGRNTVQLSFLYVHEWLWNFATTAKQIRKLNYYLHSTAFDNATAQQAKEYFNSALQE